MQLKSLQHKRICKSTNIHNVLYEWTMSMVSLRGGRPILRDLGNFSSLDNDSFTQAIITTGTFFKFLIYLFILIFFF